MRNIIDRDYVIEERVLWCEGASESEVVYTVWEQTMLEDWEGYKAVEIDTYSTLAHARAKVQLLTAERERILAHLKGVKHETP